MQKVYLCLQSKFHQRICSICLVLAIVSADGNEVKPNIESLLKEKSYKEAISLQRQFIEEDHQKRGELLKDLSIIYLKDQNQEYAFETFLESLGAANIQQKTSEANPEDDALYRETLDIYFKHSVGSQREAAEKIVEMLSPKLKQLVKPNPSAFLMALAYANLSAYENFFDLFYTTYLFFPEHYLAYKTKAILHIKLLERKRSESERQFHRQQAILNFECALSLQPKDTTLYKLLITFSSAEAKEECVRQCLNKIIEENIIIPRSDILFYVHEAGSVKNKALAEQFLDKARQWYRESRIISSAENYLQTCK